MGGVSVVDLVSKTACDGLLPVRAGQFELSEVLPDAITSIAPFAGEKKKVSEALKAVHGMGFPAPNRATGKDRSRCIWVGPGQAMLVGPKLGDLSGAATTDQTDGWAVMRLQGADCEDVLARLVPVDLRLRSFKSGHTARTRLFHAPLSITRTGADRFELMVFRSMAKTVVDELLVAMKSVAVQQEPAAP